MQAFREYPEGLIAGNACFLSLVICGQRHNPSWFGQKQVRWLSLQAALAQYNIRIDITNVSTAISRQRPSVSSELLSRSPEFK